MKRILGWAILGVAAGYAIKLLRNVAVNTAIIAMAIEADDDLIMCGCADDEFCDLCSLPIDDDGFQLGDQDEQQFRGIIESFGPEEAPDVE